MSYAVLAVEMGGHAVKKIYDENALNIQLKGQTDVGKAELLTKADLVSNHLILDLLQRFSALGMTIISEEKASAMSEEEVSKYRDDNYQLWLDYKDALNLMPSTKYDMSRMNIWIDPLDATQEFTEGLTQYVTTMACITIDGKPVFGAIYRPFFDETIIGLVNWGVLSTKHGKMVFDTNETVPKTVVVSRSHAGKVQELVNTALKGQYTVEPAGGSGYKTLRLINSTAEYYIHSTAIKKWDLCAGDAIIRAAGGALIDLEGESIDYNSKLPVLNKKGLFMARKNVYSSFMKIKDYLKI
jgi:inositol monophosphatase 3